MACPGRTQPNPDGRWLSNTLDHASPPSVKARLQTYAWNGHLENFMPWTIGRIDGTGDTTTRIAHPVEYLARHQFRQPYPQHHYPICFHNHTGNFQAFRFPGHNNLQVNSGYFIPASTLTSDPKRKGAASNPYHYLISTLAPIPMVCEGNTSKVPEILFPLACRNYSVAVEHGMGSFDPPKC